MPKKKTEIEQQEFALDGQVDQSGAVKPSPVPGELDAPLRHAVGHRRQLLWEPR